MVLHYYSQRKYSICFNKDAQLACFASACINGGTCVNASNPYTTHFTCDCPSGYQGSNCETGMCMYV